MLILGLEGLNTTIVLVSLKETVRALSGLFANKIKKNLKTKQIQQRKEITLLITPQSSFLVKKISTKLIGGNVSRSYTCQQKLKNNTNKSITIKFSISHLCK